MVTTALVRTALPRQQETTTTIRGSPYKKKARHQQKKVPSEKKKAKTLISPCLHRTFDAIDNPAENPSHFSRSPIIQLTGKSTMPSSQPLYRTLHPINITKTSSMRSMGKWESIEIGRLRAFVVFLSNLPSSIFRQETDRRTPHCTNDVSPLNWDGHRRCLRPRLAMLKFLFRLFVCFVLRLAPREAVILSGSRHRGAELSFYLPDGRSLDTNGCFGGIQNPIFRTLFLSTTTSVTPPVHMSFSTIDDDTQATRISRTSCPESDVIVIVVLDAFGG